MKKLARSLIVFLLLVVSCDKPAVHDPTKTDLLTAQPWLVEKAEEREGNDPWTDVFPYWASCDKDNTWRFNRDMSLEYNESALACSPNNPNQVLDLVTWSFSENESKLIADGITFTLLQLDMNTLVILESTTINGVASSRRITFHH